MPERSRATERRSRLAELVAHLADCETTVAADAIGARSFEIVSADAALGLAARAMTDLSATARHLRVAPYLGRPDPLAHHRVGTAPADRDRFAPRTHGGRLRQQTRPVGTIPTGRAFVG